MAIFDNFRNQMQRPGGFGRRFSPQQLPQQPSRFSGGLGGLFGGMGGYNPYQQQSPMMGGGGFNPYMGGGGFNPYMGGGGFNPYMGGGGFNPYMGGGGFNPMMGGGGFNPYMGGGGRRGGFGRPGMFGGGRRGGFQGYDFNSPIGEAPPGVEPTPPPSISDLFSGLDDDQRNSFLQQFGLAPTPTPRPDVDERDMFDSGSVPGEPGFSIEQDPRDIMVGTLGGSGFGRFPLGTAGPEFVYDEAGNPIMGPPSGQIPIPPQDLGFGPGIIPSEIIGPDGQFIGSGGVTPPVPDNRQGMPEEEFEIPGIDLERIRESLAKIEPIIPGISLPQPQPVPVRPRKPMPDFLLPPINEFDNPLFSDPGLGGEGMGGIRPMPMPMPQPMPIKGPMPMPQPIPVKGPRQPIKVSPPKIMPQPIPVKGPRQTIKTSPPKIMPMPQPMPMPGPPVNPFDNPLFSDPGIGGEGGGRNVPMPMPMPAPMPKIRPMPAPLPRVISDPVRPKPAPITRGIGGVRRMPAGRRR